MYKKILVTTDGSELAEKGVDTAIDLAQKLDAELYIVTVATIIPPYGIVAGSQWAPSPSSFEEYKKEMEASAKEILETALNKAKAKHIKTKAIEVENQQPGPGIVDAAEKYDIDLIVMASHGRRGFNRLILGSQTNEVLSLTKKHLLIVK